ncbi:chromosome partitioning protein [Sulfitobacter brevis]|uniref:Chromosome partitioning protein n=1 Tax=Sulfitobacter brevis TaxID=74348 RepID=A0A1I2GAK5_9RHOB|nr:AAA family ATPase [Sulfitobacter brevis]SFF14615.1 chromosome partitioning protein [Sulfitobacter brevis]
MSEALAVPDASVADPVIERQSTLQFVDKISMAMGQLDTRVHRDETLSKRVTRRFSKNEVASFMGIQTQTLVDKGNSDDDLPAGQRIGRETTYSPSDMMQMRGMLGSRSTRRREYIHWRQPEDPLTVVAFGSQKGGTGKSLSAAHFAQYLSLAYGLRVGVIDADPQATASLYFADETTKLFDEATLTLADFMGVGEPGAQSSAPRTPEELDAIWQQTAWPGIRLIPGGANILNGDVALYLKARSNKKPYRTLKDAIDLWDRSYPPKTVLKDLRNKDGSFNQEAYENALGETLDVIVIDQQPSITLMQLNCVVAADTLIIPITLKGFDLSTLTTYVNSLGEYLAVVCSAEKQLEVGRGGHIVLPTIVQSANDRDIAQISDLHLWAPGGISKVWYARSDAIANAAEEYMSIYEYTPPTNRRASAKSFMTNANAVNDYLVGRVLPSLPSRGFGETFVKEFWG